MTIILPSTIAKLPTRSKSSALESILLDICDFVSACRPMNSGSMQWTSGLSTWK